MATSKKRLSMHEAGHSIAYRLISNQSPQAVIVWEVGVGDFRGKSEPPVNFSQIIATRQATSYGKGFDNLVIESLALNYAGWLFVSESLRQGVNGIECSDLDCVPGFDGFMELQTPLNIYSDHGANFSTLNYFQINPTAFAKFLFSAFDLATIWSKTHLKVARDITNNLVHLSLGTQFICGQTHYNASHLSEQDLNAIFSRHNI